MQTVIFFLVLAVIWVLIMFNGSLKRSIKKAGRGMKIPDLEGGWVNSDCSCETPRMRWKALAMNRPDNRVLLICPKCGDLWEEQMSLYGNRWRPVSRSYADENYSYEYDKGKGDLPA